MDETFKLTYIIFLIEDDGKLIPFKGEYDTSYRQYDSEDDAKNDIMKEGLYGRNLIIMPSYYMLWD